MGNVINALAYYITMKSIYKVKAIIKLLTDYRKLTSQEYNIGSTLIHPIAMIYGKNKLVCF
jgi:hypothetical protein